MKQILLNKVDAILSNPHTSSAAIVGFGLTISIVIWPQYATKLSLILGIAQAYGFAMAGDGKPKDPAK